VSHEPVLDTSDLEAIAALADPGDPQPPSFALLDDPDRSLYQAAQDEYRWAVWVRQARALAAAGVRPCPSHQEVTTPEGEPRLWRSSWNAFHDAQDLAAQTSRRRHPAPLVVFGFEVKPHNLQLPFLPSGYDWIAVANQTGGMACHHRYIVGIVLDVRADRKDDIDELDAFADRNGHSCVGLLGEVSLTELRAYGELVDRLGLSAEFSWRNLEEGCYPLDESAAALISDTPIPTWEERYPPLPDDAPPLEKLQAMGPLVDSPWMVWVLGENCD
jgi:hypothetical protein